MICVSIAESSFESCLAAVQRESFCEIRLDQASFSPEQITTLFSSGNRIIATCRPGNHDDAVRKEMLIRAIESGATFVDIELEASSDYRNEIIKVARKRNCQVIVSFHDFLDTPVISRLEKNLELCYCAGADIAKIACMVNDREALLRLFQLYYYKGRKVIVGMGLFGPLSRVAALSLGSEFTFASLTGGKQTAPGQLTRQAMEQILTILGIHAELKQLQ